MDFIIQVSYGSLAAVYSVLLLLTFYRVSGELVWHFRGLCLASILWVTVVCYAAISPDWLFSDTWFFESTRNLLLGLLLLRLWQLRVSWPRWVILAVLVSLMFIDLVGPARIAVQQFTGTDPRLPGHLVVTILLLSMLEQVYAGVDNERRWAVKYFFLGLLALLLFDLFLYAEAVLYQHLNDALLAARGIANLLVVPLFLLAGVRNPHWDAKLVVSHQAAFRTVSLLLVGGYLLAVAIAGFYVRDFGGRWGDLLLLLVVFFAAMILFMLMSSGQVRSALSVLIAKNFFRLKYDYREQWIRATRALDKETDGDNLQDRCLKVLCDPMDSRGALIWRRSDHRSDKKAFVACGFWNMLRSRYEAESLTPSAITFMEKEGWVIDLEEYRSFPDRYPASLDLGFLAEDQDLWLVIPLIREVEIFAVVVLATPRSMRDIGWEDHDFIKLLAQQVASYLSLADAHNELAKAKQFEAFNRVSAFVVHDLKNINAQLRLLVSNMALHRTNPEFIDDCVETINHSVSKMDRMLSHLNGDKAGERAVGTLSFGSQVRAIAHRFSSACKVFDVSGDSTLPELLLDEQRFSSAVENIVKNAVESAGGAGEVKVEFGLDTSSLRPFVTVSDNGPGLSEEFIEKSLFQPFQTTKGNAGMGIGLFDAREYMKSIGGDIVLKNRDEGWTRFTLRFPPLDAIENHAIAGG
ncbi:XrtA/PEP-CTERM system histidine kinase PrsK [Aestuariirhabdus sp. LZHN29]|uniref:XrtA/PEP-CTERM system histidine kinase PrsK n=1 Tax=Aestuariirhabdus sp. LZHN29 TaxID=3417462 RepID=UPI003CEC8F25